MSGGGGGDGGDAAREARVAERLREREEEAAFENEANFQKLRVLAVPRRAPFANVHAAYKGLFAAAAAAGALGAVPFAVPWAAAPPLFAAWYVALLSLPVGRRFAASLGVWLAATALLAAAAGLAGAAVLAAEAWLVTYATVRYESFPPAKARATLGGTIKSMYHWAKYFRPGPRHLAGAAGAAAAAAATGPGAAAVRALGGSPAALGALAASALAAEARLWWRGRRPRTVAVDAYAREVIEAQAKAQRMPVEEYSRVYLGMFGPSPLVLPEWRWRACHADGPPCFTHYYVDFLGINTPPCCAQRLADMAAVVTRAATEAKLPTWIDGGSLLGPLRQEGDWVPWEDDVDLAYLCPDGGGPLPPDAPQLRAVQRAAERDGMTWTVGEAPGHYVHALSVRSPPFPLDAEVLRLSPWRALHLDLIPARLSNTHGARCVVRKKLAYDYGVRRYVAALQMWPLREVLPLGTIEARGHTFPAPAKPRAYLHSLYGDWETLEYTYVDGAVTVGARIDVDRRHLARFPLVKIKDPREREVVDDPESDWSD